MKFKWRKKAQKEIAKAIRQINSALEKDPLWKGRFICHFHEVTHSETYEDGSGGYLVAETLLVDKKTMKAATLFASNYSYRWFPIYVNEFIVEDIKVWEENPKPNLNSESYTHIKWNDIDVSKLNIIRMHTSY